MSYTPITRTEFEAALPTHKNTGRPLWRSLGIVDGEYAYEIPVGDTGAVIVVRSTILTNGISRGAGKDSIRCWLHDPVRGLPIYKEGCWVCRTRNWASNLLTLLRKLYRLQSKAGGQAGRPNHVRRVKKEGPNKGRFFASADGTFLGWVAE